MEIIKQHATQQAQESFLSINIKVDGVGMGPYLHNNNILNTTLFATTSPTLVSSLEVLSHVPLSGIDNDITFVF